MGRKVYYNSKTKSTFAELTDAEYVEVFEKIHYYWPLLLEDLELFYEAFIQKNDLGAKSNSKDGETKELSEEELQKLRKLFKMMQGVETKHFNKQLKS